MRFVRFTLFLWGTAGRRAPFSILIGKGVVFLEPILLSAPCKDYIWGGTRLRTLFHKISPLCRLAESWELSCHKDGPSVLASGPDAGATLPAYLHKMGPDILGEDCKRFDFFPVLIKLIDAKENLSVQVHPNNDYALRAEGEYGKTEMWYVLDAAPGAVLYYGLNRPATKDEFRAKIEDGSLIGLLRAVPVKKGDVFFIEAGTIHAIGAGILLAEIQQNSNTTYRVFDYGRGRPLHIDKALDVAQLQPIDRSTRPAGPTIQFDGYSSTLLAACEFFTVFNLDVETSAHLSVGNESFHSLLCIEGNGTIEYQDKHYPLQMGDSYFLPASMGNYVVTGRCGVLLTSV